MRIETITLYHLRMPLVAPFETSFGRVDQRECILVEIGSQGLTGFGECSADRDPGYSYETVGTAWHVLRDFIIPSVLGADVDSLSQFGQRVEQVRGHHLAKAGLEMALWDLLGKRDSRSLKEMLGGEADNVPVGVSVGIQESPDMLVRTVAGYVERGYRRIKIKIKPGRDVVETQEVRLAFPETALQVDANSAYSLETARSLLPLDTLGLLLIEQPLAEDDLWDHSRLQKYFNTPLCLDESILSARHAR
ncbi:MAG: o-succinylbenzoate synthase, partial [Anaerolineales bacterium]